MDVVEGCLGFWGPHVTAVGVDRLARVHDSIHAHVHVHYSYMTLIGMHELHGPMHPMQLESCNCFVGSCGPTHHSHPMISTTSASRYGPLKFWLLNNCQQIHVHMHV